MAPEHAPIAAQGQVSDPNVHLCLHEFIGSEQDRHQRSAAPRKPLNQRDSYDHKFKKQLKVFN